MKTKLIKQLDRAYSQRASLLNKNFIKDTTTGLALFVEQLKYIRDKLIMNSTTKTADPFEGSDELDKEVTLLIVAIAEFEAYQKSEGSQRTFHWNNFWEFVKLNAEGWMMPNDTI
jgi:hypothetical protein